MKGTQEFSDLLKKAADALDEVAKAYHQMGWDLTANDYEMDAKELRRKELQRRAKESGK